MIGDFFQTTGATFSRWAIRRLVKFALKKKASDYILGDIDLDQVDVQFRKGTVQLNDVALNVDFLNNMLGNAPIMVKEGSIGSLSLKIPLNMKDWQIEVEELELVLAPCVSHKRPAAFDNAHREDHNTMVSRPKMPEKSKEEFDSGSDSLEVHEGVKTVAKIVKLFLTSFRIRLKNLIIAFDPGSEAVERKPELSRALVIRIAEIEFGTCLSEDANPFCGSSILGISKLTNFIKFQGALAEFLEINDLDNSERDCSLLRSFNEFNSENSQRSAYTTRILGGPTGGFSGVLDLSIPWKNGGLDIRKLNAEITIDPVHLTLHPNTILWFISLGNCLKDARSDDIISIHLPSDSGNGKHMSQFGSSDESDLPPLVTEGHITSGDGCISFGSASPLCQETSSDALLPGPCVINNWIPSSVDLDKTHEFDSVYVDSIDQFFECFDGMRNSQAGLGNSGIWNLAYSVFGAITVASSLASGLDHVPQEQQNVETNFKATVSVFTIILALHDEIKYTSQLIQDPQEMFGMSGTQYKSFTSAGPIDGAGFESCMSSISIMDSEQFAEEGLGRHDEHVLNITCFNFAFTFHVLPQSTKFMAKIQHINVVDHFVVERALGNNCIRCPNDFGCRSHSVHYQQEGVQGALPPFISVFKDGKRAHSSCTGELYPGIPSADDSRHAGTSEAPPFDESSKMTLFESFGECSGEYSTSYTNLSGKTTAAASFSVNLPPFIFWVDVHLLNLLINLCKKVGTLLEFSKSEEDSGCDGRDEILNLSTDIDVKDVRQIKPMPSKDVQGNIQLPTARIILCFNLEGCRHSCQIFQWDKFISVDFSEVSSGKAHDAKKIPTWNSRRGSAKSDFTSISLDSGRIDVYLVSVACKDVRAGFQSTCGQLYSASKILSATRKLNNLHPTVCLFWQKQPKTDPQMMRRVWDLATSRDIRTRNKVTVTGNEFASVTIPDVEEANCQVRQELIHSSSFLIQLHFSLVSVNLAHHDYVQLHHIACKMLDVFSYDANHGAAIGERSESNENANCQSSFLVEFDFLDLCITFDVVEEASKLLQRELSGSWTSLRLKVEKFQLLSVSKISGFRDARFSWISHGEGDLWGSISSVNDNPSAASHEFVLITCRNSIQRRGDGVGGNAISSGPAGTFILNLTNPTASRVFTSIAVRCATIIAPGCRLDWFNAIASFFMPSMCHEETYSHPQNITSDDDVCYKASFFLDLVDVAISYEPQVAHIGESGYQCSKRSSKNYVACILAASSFNLYQIAEDAGGDYNISLQDMGLLICCWPGNDGERRYDADHLRKSGYVKIASDAVVEALVRTNCRNDLLWEVEFSSLHTKLSTCSDTTMGLVCLLGQLQQLFAPDIEESLSHLQSRWISTRTAHESGKHSMDENSGSMEVKPQVGLMDELVDDIFLHQTYNTEQSNSCNFQNVFLGSKDIVDETGASITSCNTSMSSHSISSDGLGQGSTQEILQSSHVDRICLPEIMESYYVTELLPTAKHSLGSHSPLDVVQAGASSLAIGEKSGWYDNTSLVIIENHVSVVTKHNPEKQTREGEDINTHPFSAGTCKPRGRIILKNAEIRWMLFGGSDWPDAGKTSSENSNSANRDQSQCLEVRLFGVNLQYDMYPDGELIVSRLSLSLQDFFVYDNSLNAPWRTILGYYNSKQFPRESHAKALRLDLEFVRPDPAIPLEEYRLQLAVLPIRVHLDQSQVDFLVSFFTGVSISKSCDLENDVNLRGHVEDESIARESLPQEALLPFFQKCDIGPVVLLVDYIPHHIDVSALRAGNYVELINLVPWKGIELQLKHVCTVGIYGWGGVCDAVAGEWLEDISKNQVHKLLKGLKPISSLFSVGSGAAKLVSLPVKDYKKDRRLIKGMQRGAVSFLRSISVEAVGLGVHLAAGFHDALLKTECALSTTSEGKKTSSTISNQPKDVSQGMQQAYESLSDGVSRTASALVGKPLKTYQHGAGAGAALANAIRAAPAAAVTPASSAARAVHFALLGVRNSLDPEHKRDSMEKYNGSSRYPDYRQ